MTTEPEAPTHARDGTVLSAKHEGQGRAIRPSFREDVTGNTA